MAMSWSTAVFAQAGASADAEVKLMTHGELAQLLVRRLGLFRLLPGNPTDLDCMMLLSQYGIYPSPTTKATERDPTPGWSLDENAEVSLAQLAVLIVRALGLEDQVQGDKADPQNWLNLLRDLEVPTDTIGGAVAQVRPLSDFPVLQPLFEVITDPITRRYLPDSQVFLMFGTLTFPDLGAPAVKTTETKEEGKRPRPITPT
jgi:hypothetical protein